MKTQGKVHRVWQIQSKPKPSFVLRLTWSVKTFTWFLSFNWSFLSSHFTDTFQRLKNVFPGFLVIFFRDVDQINFHTARNRRVFFRFLVTQKLLTNGCYLEMSLRTPPLLYHAIRILSLLHHFHTYQSKGQDDESLFV